MSGNLFFFSLATDIKPNLHKIIKHKVFERFFLFVDSIEKSLFEVSLFENRSTWSQKSKFSNDQRLHSK